MPEFKNQGNLFGAAPDRPYHLSVGVVVLNADNDVLALYYPTIDEVTTIYVLPNKTVKPNETPTDTAIRGAKQELGCDIQIITFLGSTQTQDTWWNEIGTPKLVEKTVLYFLARATNQDSAVVKDVNESEGRTVVAKTFGFLIENMNKTVLKDGMRDFNHASILARAQTWISAHPDLRSETL